LLSLKLRQEIFEEVELSEEGGQVKFKSTDLVGYFDIKILSIRYDYPDPDLYNYRAEVELLAEFRTLQHEKIWNELFRGEGVGFSNVNLRLTRFGRESASALEDAYQNGVSDLEDEVFKSEVLREYFRNYLRSEEPSIASEGKTRRRPP
jgi:hypothetical protein